MPDHDKVARFAEMPGQGFGDVDRAMLAAGAADRHGQIAALARLEARQPRRQEPAQVGDHGRHVRLVFQKLDHRPVEAGQDEVARLKERVDALERQLAEVQKTREAEGRL